MRRIARRDLHRYRAALRRLAAIYFLYDTRHSRRYPVYIGQTADAYRRLCQHRRLRSHWDIALTVAPAQDQPPFTLTDIHYLEARLLCVARRRRRVGRRLQNYAMPAPVYAPPERRQRLDLLLASLSILLATGPPGNRDAGRSPTRSHSRGHPLKKHHRSRSHPVPGQPLKCAHPPDLSPPESSLMTVDSLEPVVSLKPP